MSYIALATTTLGSATGSVTFSSIPATYRDLVVVIDAKSGAGVATIGLRFNSDTGNNYSYVDMSGTGSSTSSSANTQDRATMGFVGGTSAYMSTAQIMDYAQTDKHKTVLARHSNASGNVQALANRWANTNAITTVNLSTAVNNFPVGTTLSLYGVA